jgi:hypothetical protein
LNNQGSPADEILGIAQLEAVGFEQLSWWHKVMIILPSEEEADPLPWVARRRR